MNDVSLTALSELCLTTTSLGHNHTEKENNSKRERERNAKEIKPNRRLAEEEAKRTKSSKY